MTAAKKTEKTAETFETMAAINPEAFKEGYEKFAEGVTVAADFNKDTFDAFIASAGAFAKGFEKITAEQTNFFKSAFETTVANAKAVASAKSPQEAFDLNNEFARNAVETNLGQVNKTAGLWMETAKETVEPLSVRYSEMVEKIQAYRP